MKLVRGDHDLTPNCGNWGIELTRSELTVLLAKLDIPDSARAFTHSTPDGSEHFWVHAVEDKAHGLLNLDQWWNGERVLVIPVQHEEEDC